MQQATFCQSCSMPMDGEDLWGTEPGGSKSTRYCKFCYQNGSFTHPEFTLETMKAHMMEKMQDAQLPADILEAAISRLPFLERWNTSEQTLHSTTLKK